MEGTFPPLRRLLNRYRSHCPAHCEGTERLPATPPYYSLLISRPKKYKLHTLSDEVIGLHG